MRNTGTDRGACLAETAISLGVFLFFILGSFELSRLAYYKVALHYISSASMRQAVLGESLPLLTEVETVKQRTIDLARPFGIHLSDSNIEVCETANYNGVSCGSNTLGSQKYMIIKVSSLYSFGLGLFRGSLSGEVIARKEPV